jgi:glycine betaine/choline ABC-type transport system substrate-binding protein
MVRHLDEDRQTYTNLKLSTWLLLQRQQSIICKESWWNDTTTNTINGNVQSNEMLTTTATKTKLLGSIGAIGNNQSYVKKFDGTTNIQRYYTTNF